MHSKGGMRQEWREWEGQNSGEQRHYEICGRERDGAGNTGIQDGYHEGFQDLTRQETFRKEGREFEGGGFWVD